MDVLIERCAGIDIGKRTVAVTVRTPDGEGGRRQETRTFGTVTRHVLELRDWLVAEGVTVAAMEATSDYRRPVFYLLEDAMETWLLNAHHLKAVPGRKTDVKDAEWIAQLVEHGLVQPSFVPPPPIRELRDLTRYRKTIVEERTREVQRLEKLLEDAGIKLSSVASRTLGVSGRAMIEALINGERDAAVPANLAQRRLRKKIPELTEALLGRFGDHHALLAREMLGRIDAADATIARLSEEIEIRLAPFREHVELLITIPGVAHRTAQVIIAETGGDMSVFGSAERLASWAGMCPGNNESAGKRKSGRTRKGSKWLRSRWWSRRTRPPAPTTPTSARSSGGSLVAAGNRAPPSPSATPSSSSPTTCSISTSPTRTSAATTSSAGSPNRPASVASSPSSSGSARRSPSNPWRPLPPEPSLPVEEFTIQAATPCLARITGATGARSTLTDLHTRRTPPRSVFSRQLARFRFSATCKTAGQHTV